MGPRIASNDDALDGTVGQWADLDLIWAGFGPSHLHLMRHVWPSVATSAHARVAPQRALCSAPQTCLQLRGTHAPANEAWSAAAPFPPANPSPAARMPRHSPSSVPVQVVCELAQGGST